MAQLPVAKCDLCENNGGYFCHECSQSLCASCKNLHNKISSTKDHKVSDICEIGSLDLESEITCQTHKEPYKLFCRSNACKKLICSSCVATDHNGHYFSSVAEAANLKREQLSNYISSNKTNIEKIDNIMIKIKKKYSDKLNKQTTKLISEINSMTTAIHIAVDRIREIKTQEIEDFRSLEENKLDESYLSYKDLRENYAIVCSTFENILNEAHDVTFLMSYEANKIEMNQLESVKDFEVPRPVAPFDHHSFMDDLENEIQDRYPRRSENQGPPQRALPHFNTPQDVVRTQSSFSKPNISVGYGFDDVRRESRELTVKNLPRSITENELREFFEGFGAAVEDLSIDNNDNNGGKSKTSAVVVLCTKAKADYIMSRIPLSFKGKNRLTVERTCSTQFDASMRGQNRGNRRAPRRISTASNRGRGGSGFGGSDYGGYTNEQLKLLLQ